MDPTTSPVPVPNLGQIIRTVRQQRVILDRDLARLYGVETRALNQAVKRNHDRFPDEFAFELSREEILSISQSVTSLASLRFAKQVRAFTEHGALMAATVLNSPQAVKMSLFIIRAFVKIRELQAANAVRWTPKIGPPVKMDFRWSAGEKADAESKTQTASCGLQGQSGIRSPGWA